MNIPSPGEAPASRTPELLQVGRPERAPACGIIQSGRSPDGKTDLDRIIACLDRFCSFDMLCVQEVSSGYTEGGEDRFAMLRERLPGYAGIEAIACDTAVTGAAPAGATSA